MISSNMAGESLRIAGIPESDNDDTDSAVLKTVVLSRSTHLRSLAT